jgi:predicted MPP superfamily phosphohydrolase
MNKSYSKQRLKLAVASDLHLVFGGLELYNTENADVLVLAGDIAEVCDMVGEQPRHPEYLEFFAQVCREFPNVVYVLGNHEHYGHTLEDSVGSLRQVLGHHHNLRILDNETLVLGNFVIFGGTAWTDMNDSDPLTLMHMRTAMNDFRTISTRRRLRYGGMPVQFTPEDSVDEHYRFIEHLFFWLEEYRDKQFVVVSHHAPSFQSIHHQYANMQVMNGAFASNLNHVLAEPNIQLWIHGHMHDAVDYQADNVRVFSNPRGYHRYEPQTQHFALKYVEVVC